MTFSELTPIIVAIVGATGLVIAARFGAQRFSSGDQTDANAATMREDFEFSQSLVSLWRERYENEVEDHGVDKRRLELTQHDLDDCERQKSGLYAELRRKEPR